MQQLIFPNNSVAVDSASFVIKKLQDLSQNAILPLLVGVSGGNSPKPLYDMLSTHITSELAEKIIIVQIDERIVDPNHDDSNQRLVRTHLKGLLEKGARFHAMPVDSHDSSGCASYETLLQEYYTHGALPSIALLGVGGDGHTASIFPDQLEYLPHDERLVFMTPFEKNGYYRMSLTYRALLMMKSAVFYIPGKEKQEIIRTISDDTQKSVYPASYILHSHSDAYLISSS